MRVEHAFQFMRGWTRHNIIFDHDERKATSAIHARHDEFVCLLVLIDVEENPALVCIPLFIHVRAHASESSMFDGSIRIPSKIEVSCCEVSAPSLRSLRRGMVWRTRISRCGSP